MPKLSMALSIASGDTPIAMRLAAIDKEAPKIGVDDKAGIVCAGYRQLTQSIDDSNCRRDGFSISTVNCRDFDCTHLRYRIEEVHTAEVSWISHVRRQMLKIESRRIGVNKIRRCYYTSGSGRMILT